MSSPSTSPSHDTPSVTATTPTRGSRLRRAALIGTLAIGIAITGAFTASAFGGGYGFGPWGYQGGGPMMRGNGPGMGPFGGGWFFQGGPQERADRFVRHMAVELDATPDQVEKLRALVRTAMADLSPLRDSLRQGRMDGRDLLLDPALDAAKIEAFRAKQMQTADAMSRRFAQAVTEASQILTPEQRRTLAERMAAFQNRWR